MDGEILIVGAGPVGLTAAIELTRRGLPVRIIDNDTGPSPQSRAIGINPRTLDILEPSGVTEKLLAAGLKVPRFTFWRPGKALFSLETGLIPHRYNFILSLPQTQTETILAEQLNGYGIAVGWSTALVTLAPGRNGAVCELKNQAGDIERVTPRIVIGADGAHSVVRKSLGIGFQGEVYDHEWGLADVRITSPYAKDELHVFDAGGYLFGLIPLPGGLVRMVCNSQDILAHVPSGVRVNEVIWQTQFRISHRLVETYQRGPVFLAGDAAHIHSPAGGRGMNLGIEDAAWLAHLIAAGDTDRYTALRKPIAATVIRQVDAGTRFITSQNPLTRALRRYVLPAVASLPAMQSRALTNLAGLAFPAPPWLQSGR